MIGHTLGPSNSLELLDALEDAQLEEKRLTAARAATIISAAKVTTSDSYVSGALGKLAAGIPGTSTTPSSADTAGAEPQASARKRTDMTKFPSMFGGEVRPVSQAASI